MSASHLTGALFLILTILTLVGCQAPSGDAEAGKKWFTMNNCSSCHGLNGDDGKAKPIAGLTMGFGSFVRKLRTTDAPIMPPFPESKVSEQDAADIYAYLRSKKPSLMSQK
jgi:mono/diheme cytochrome c family protein